MSTALRPVAALALLSVAMPMLSTAETSLQGTKPSPPIEIPTEVRFVSTAPHSSTTSALRVALLVEEAYFSLLIDELAFGGTEEEPNRVAASYFFSGFALAPLVGQSKLTALEFVRWLGPREFELREQEQDFRVRYEGNGNIKVERERSSSPPSH